MTYSEKICNEIASKFFLNEFTYKNLRYDNNGIDQELCDGLIECGGGYLVIQIKERNAENGNDYKWLEKKVYKKAVQQIKDSIVIIKTKCTHINGTISDMYNQRIIINPNYNIYPIIVFLNTNIKEYDRIYLSSSGVNINIFSIEDYQSMMEVIKVPVDIRDYLDFRIDFFRNKKEKFFPDISIQEFDDTTIIAKTKNEKGFATFFNARYTKDVDDIAVESFMFILKNFKERLIKEELEYKNIIQKLIIFGRKEMNEFVKHWLYVSQNKTDKFEYERLMVVDFGEEKIGCLFGCLSTDNKMDNDIYLQYVIELFRQKFKLDVAMFFICYKMPHEKYFMKHIYLEKKYENDVQLEQLLKDCDPWGKYK